MKARKKGRVRKVAKMIVRALKDGMKDIPPEEQERRLKSFCDAAEDQLRTQAKPSGSSPIAQDRRAARGHA